MIEKGIGYIVKTVLVKVNLIYVISNIINRKLIIKKADKHNKKINVMTLISRNPSILKKEKIQKGREHKYT